MAPFSRPSWEIDHAPQEPIPYLLNVLFSSSVCRDRRGSSNLIQHEL